MNLILIIILGEKILLLEILEKSAKELGDNPKKYEPEKYNEYEETNDFYFKPITTKYCNSFSNLSFLGCI